MPAAFKGSNVLLFNCSIIQLFKVQMPAAFKNSTVLLFKGSKVQIPAALKGSKKPGTERWLLKAGERSRTPEASQSANACGLQRFKSLDVLLFNCSIVQRFNVLLFYCLIPGMFNRSIQHSTLFPGLL